MSIVLSAFIYMSYNILLCICYIIIMFLLTYVSEIVRVMQFSVRSTKHFNIEKIAWLCGNFINIIRFCTNSQMSREGLDHVCVMCSMLGICTCVDGLDIFSYDIRLHSIVVE